MVSGYTGFSYGPSGEVVSVPTQHRVPLDAATRAYPVHDDGTFVWVWLGEPSLATQRPVPKLGWLADEGWTTFGDAWETAADVALLHENLADITHVAVVHPDIAPPVLRSAPPPLEVSVTETTVSFSRDYPPAVLLQWQSRLLGLPEDAEHAQHEEGMFLTPGLWADRWDVTIAGHGDLDGTATFRFTHALCPVQVGRTRHLWRVSRNVALGEEVTEQLRPVFTEYYQRVKAVLETMQTVLDTDGPSRQVAVSADAAALAVARILRRMVADEAG